MGCSTAICVTDAHLYTLAAYLLAPLYCAVLWWRGWRERGYWRHFGSDLDSGPAVGQPGIWLHAASMGEVQAASALIRKSAGANPGLAVIDHDHNACRTRACAGAVWKRLRCAICRWICLGAVRRFLDRVRAARWRSSSRPSCGPICIASASIVACRWSWRARGSRRARWGATDASPRLFEVILSRIVIAAQTQEDAQRFRSIGAMPRAALMWSATSSSISALPPEVARAGREPCASVMRPDGPYGSRAARMPAKSRRCSRRIGWSEGLTPSALLVMVPRHPPRFAEVADWLTREQRRISCGARRARRRKPQTEVLLVDTLGELFDFYAAGDVAFVGGSLVPIGGHNLLEPAALGLPILTGPHISMGRISRGC